MSDFIMWYLYWLVCFKCDTLARAPAGNDVACQVVEDVADSGRY